VEQPIGEALSRDIAKGEETERELDLFIARAESKRIKEEGERPEEMAWKESVRRYNARLEAEAEHSRLAWAKHLRGVYQARMDEYDRIVETLEAATPIGGGG